MTDERAIEILDPEHLEYYESIEPVEEAARIGIKAIKRVKELEAENAELRARLEKAVELETELVYRIIENEFIGCTPITSLRVYEVMQLKRYGYFTDRAEAEARLKEIKEKNDD